MTHPAEADAQPQRALDIVAYVVYTYFADARS
jgi:hypothetical protein